MSVEEARWVRPGSPPDEESKRPYGGERLSILMRILASVLGLGFLAFLLWLILFVR